MTKIYRQAVMAVIINHEKKILIGYSPREKSYKFPQGGIEKGEDTITCIKRELTEELDYQLNDKDILSIYQEKIAYPFPPDVHPVYMGQQLQIVKIRHNPDSTIIPQDDEFSILHWIFPSELKQYNFEYRAEAYRRALEICRLL
jgi:putative (di)nucleoside polyphosphate hydrolase